MSILWSMRSIVLHDPSAVDALSIRTAESAAALEQPTCSVVNRGDPVGDGHDMSARLTSTASKSSICPPEHGKLRIGALIF